MLHYTLDVPFFEEKYDGGQAPNLYQYIYAKGIVKLFDCAWHHLCLEIKKIMQYFRH
jgi:hypothetical protein